MTHEVSWSAANVRRLQRHALHPPASQGTDPAEIAAVICGGHAQVLSAAELSLALRIQAATRTTIRQALWDDHRLIKAHGPRGTVHLLATENLPIWTAALSAIPAHSPFPDDVRLTPAQAEAIVDAIGQALENIELTIDELDRAIVDLVGPWAGDCVMPAFQDLWPRWRQAVGMAAHREVLCFGPNKGRRVTYTNPRRWLPAYRRAPEGDAIQTVITCYLYAYGPVLLIDGMVAGVWHQRRSGRRIDVTVEPLIRLTSKQRRTLEAQVERIGTILEGQARLTIGTVTTGGHA